MDVRSTLDGQDFMWDSDKAAGNAFKHGVRFEQAREVFLDQFARYEDASPQQEGRMPVSASRPTTSSCMSSMWFGKVMCSA